MIPDIQAGRQIMETHLTARMRMEMNAMIQTDLRVYAFSMTSVVLSQSIALGLNGELAWMLFYGIPQKQNLGTRQIAIYLD